MPATSSVERHNGRTLPQDNRARLAGRARQVGIPIWSRLAFLAFHASQVLADFFSILLYLHRLGYIMKRCFGDLAGPSAALGHNVVQVRGIFTQARTCVPHRRHAFNDSIGDELLAIDTADGGCPAFGIDLLLNHR